jgi:hypothetical protein
MIEREEEWGDMSKETRMGFLWSEHGAGWTSSTVAMMRAPGSRVVAGGGGFGVCRLDFISNRIRGGGVCGSVEEGLHGKGRNARRSLAEAGSATAKHKMTRERGEAAPASR